MPDCTDSEIVKWQKNARRSQQYYCDRLADRNYDSFSSEKHDYLKVKIAFSLFGSPNNLNEDDNEVKISSYNEDQRECTNLIFDKLYAKSSSEMEVAFIFLMIKQCNQQYQLPVIRFMSSEKSVLFLDHSGKIYNTWVDFMKSNKLPECQYCYPVDGWYKRSDGDDNDDDSNGINVLVDFSTSSQFNPSSNSETPTICLGAVGGALGVETIEASNYKADLSREGQAASEILRVNLEGKNISNANNLAISTNIYELTKRDEASVLDVANLSLNILFFTNEVINLERARNMIENTQKHLISLSKTKMNDQAKKGFKEFAEQNKGELRSTMHGNAKTIKSLERIHNPSQYFTDYQQMRLDITNADDGAGRNIMVKINENLLASLNEELIVHPSKWVSVNTEQRKKLLKCIEEILTDPVKALEHAKKVKNICRSERLTFQKIRQSTMTGLAKRLQVSDAADFQINGKKVFQNLQPHEIDRIGNVLESKGGNATEELIRCVTHVAEKVGCKSSGEYCGILEYCYEYINRDRAPTAARKKTETRPRISDVVNDLLSSRNQNGGKMDGLIRKFRNDLSLISDLNRNASPGFASHVLAAYHYIKHNRFGPKNEEVSRIAYFKKLKDMTGCKKLKDSAVSSLTQEGDKMVCTLKNPDDGTFCVLIEPSPLFRDGNGGVIVATLYYDRRCHAGK